VVPEAFESGVMLASHTLLWVGIPLSRVMRRVALVREEQYRLLRGLFRGHGDEPTGADRLGVQVRAVRRPGTKAKLSPAEAGPLQAGDVVVLLGAPELVGAAEDRLLRGRQEKAGPRAGCSVEQPA
jgi:CPA2 family monovalent cation:H+ antiporter-2